MGAQTFGAAATDDVVWNCNITTGGGGTPWLVMMWVYPTTLTAGRTLFGFGNTACVQINAATDELRLITQNATTNGEWTTTGIDLAINEWKFIAISNGNRNSDVSSYWRAWSGTWNSPLVEATVSNDVVAAGNFTGNANFYVGNRGTGSVAFQGSIGEVILLNQNSLNQLFVPIITDSAASAMSNANALLNFERAIRKAWAGEMPLSQGQLGPILSGNTRSWFYWPGDDVRVFSGHAGGTPIDATTIATINGATRSGLRPPRPFHMPFLNMPRLAA